MQPLSAAEWSYLVGALLFLMALLWMLPSCGDDACTAVHARHVGAERAANIERTHTAFHGADRPNPLCSLCQARKRDADTPCPVCETPGGCTPECSCRDCI